MASSGLDQASQDRLRELGRMLRQLEDDGTLRRAILKDLRAPALVVAGTMRSTVRALGGSAPSAFKSHAAANVRVTAKITGTNPNVSVTLRRSGSGPAIRPGWLLNRGTWRHPVFGNRSRWVEQRVTPPGWFDRTAQNARPRFVTEAGAALDRATDDLARRINDLN